MSIKPNLFMHWEAVKGRNRWKDDDNVSQKKWVDRQVVVQTLQAVMSLKNRFHAEIKPLCTTQKPYRRRSDGMCTSDS